MWQSTMDHEFGDQNKTYKSAELVTLCTSLKECAPRTGRNRLRVNVVLVTTFYAFYLMLDGRNKYFDLDIT